MRFRPRKGREGDDRGEADAARARALDAVVALFADNATIVNAALGLNGEERRGAAGVRAFGSGYAHSLRVAWTHFHAVTHGTDAIGLFWTNRIAAEGTSEDARPQYEGATLLRLDAAGHRIVAMRGYYDPGPDTGRTGMRFSAL